MSDKGEQQGSEGVGDSLGKIALGILGGVFVAKLLQRFSESNQASCPVCGNQIHRGIDICPHCHTGLRWN